MEVYFVHCNDLSEKIVIKEIKPKRLLLSYHYFKNKQLGEYLTETFEYIPKVMLDSGAYSAWSKGKNIALVDYMNYIDKNKEYIDNYIALDVIGDPEITVKYYEIMRMKGFNPLPVYHYGDSEETLKIYVNKHKCNYIALGNTVPIKDKNRVANWINDLTNKYPNVSFHLLGSSSKKITQNTEITSCDASSWIMMAINGYPKDIPGKTREAKTERAKFQMLKIIEEVN